MQIILTGSPEFVESPDLSTEFSEEVPSSSESSETVSEETTSEEALELLPEELATEDIITETVTEVVYQSNYTREDLQTIETSLQIIACLLFIIIIYIVVKGCRSILDILGF